ncbi:hypothetical protein [Mangrovactinospora gilvigrisea]|uniref:hypothetical protein n=1 Tax=Mangrovactinospora gilvigrisea TaxID=1428644 RepID=UPI000A596348|nr:hypothetical protein [Mangrovactinospora gilvigrisea]
MSPTALHALNTLAEGGTPNHESLSPLAVGGSAFLILLALLFIVTRFNKDR